MAMLMHGGVNYSGTTGSSTITLTQAEYDLLPVEEQMDPEKVYYITDGVQTSTTIVPNPTTQATQELTKLQINETVYELAGGSEVEPNPEDDPTDTLEKLEIDGTVYELAGGSAAIELTLSEYEELSEEEKTDPTKVYYIKDVENEARFVRSPFFYSTEEAEVGVGENGKPLYQKTVRSGVIAADSVESTAFLTNIDTYHLISLKVISNDDAYSWAPFSISMYNVAGVGTYYGYVYYVKNDNSLYFVNNSRANTIKVEVVIQYTKTTDTAGSGRYADFGVPAVHYSTNEHVIGTWLDGKPLYQKTITHTNSQSSFSDYYTIETLDSEIEVKKIEGEYKRDVGNNVIHIMPLGGSYSQLNGYYNVAVRIGSNNTLQYFVAGYGSQVLDMWITIQYTKTTD